MLYKYNNFNYGHVINGVNIIFYLVYFLLYGV